MVIIPWLLLYLSVEHCIVHKNYEDTTRVSNNSHVPGNNKCLESFKESSGFQNSNASSPSNNMRWSDAVDEIVSLSAH